MKEAVILEGKYKQLLACESINSKFGSLDLDFLSHTSPEKYIQTELSDCTHRDRMSFFQAILLYDKIICHDFPMEFRVSDLGENIQIDYEKFCPNDEFAILVAKDNEFANYLKPIILKYLKNFSWANKYINKAKGLSKLKIIENLYDYTFLQKELDNTMKEIFEKYKHTAFDVNNRGILRVKMYTSEVARLIETSSQSDAIILGSEYDLSNFQGDNTTQKCYNILKTEYKRIIRYLPRFESLREVLIFKEKRKKDIKRFRNVLNEMEYIFRNNGTEKTIASAIDLIQKANKELCWATELEKISKFTTYLSLPIGFLESIINSTFFGLTIAATGFLTQLAADKNKNKNNWLSLII